ncbi:uncharacterized protein LOC144428007 [Styela clava]
MFDVMENGNPNTQSIAKLEGSKILTQSNKDPLLLSFLRRASVEIKQYLHGTEPSQHLQTGTPSAETKLNKKDGPCRADNICCRDVEGLENNSTAGQMVKTGCGNLVRIPDDGPGTSGNLSSLDCAVVNKISNKLSTDLKGREISTRHELSMPEDDLSEVHEMRVTYHRMPILKRLENEKSSMSIDVNSFRGSDANYETVGDNEKEYIEKSRKDIEIFDSGKSESSVDISRKILSQERRSKNGRSSKDLPCRAEECCRFNGGPNPNFKVSSRNELSTITGKSRLKKNTLDFALTDVTTSKEENTRSIVDPESNNILRETSLEHSAKHSTGSAEDLNEEILDSGSSETHKRSVISLNIEKSNTPTNSANGMFKRSSDMLEIGDHLKDGTISEITTEKTFHNVSGTDQSDQVILSNINSIVQRKSSTLGETNQESGDSSTDDIADQTSVLGFFKRTSRDFLLSENKISEEKVSPVVRKNSDVIRRKTMKAEFAEVIDEMNDNFLDDESEMELDSRVSEDIIVKKVASLQGNRDDFPVQQSSLTSFLAGELIVEGFKPQSPDFLSTNVHKEDDTTEKNPLLPVEQNLSERNLSEFDHTSRYPHLDVSVQCVSPLHPIGEEGVRVCKFPCPNIGKYDAETQVEERSLADKESVMSHATDYSTYQAYLKDEIGEVRDIARRYRNISVILMMINILLLLGVIGGTAYTVLQYLQLEDIFKETQYIVAKCEEKYKDT